ncbi:unnamed protein product [Rhizophagus irregularis]|nr:unnamed protein product [Rhizophagus irregularis]CAB4405781.1 unnamed protein product [Rhizophagus irregularis]
MHTGWKNQETAIIDWFRVNLPGLKKSVYNSIQDRNAQINEKWNPDTVEVIQGAAFIETSTEESMQVRIDNWPSSTRAELYAILLAPYQQYS